MKTHVQKRRPLIQVYQLAGLVALTASIVKSLSTEGTDWRLICVGLGLFILANLEEIEAHLRDINEVKK